MGISRYLDALVKILSAVSDGMASPGECSRTEGGRFFYRTLNIAGWHFNGRNCYVFVDVSDGKTGVLLTGYESDAEKTTFEPRWGSPAEVLSRGGCDVDAAVWPESGKRFIVLRVSGRLSHLDGQIFRRSFYWGRVRDYDENRRGALLKDISEDFKRLLAVYCRPKFSRLAPEFPAYLIVPPRATSRRRSHKYPR